MKTILLSAFALVGALCASLDAQPLNPAKLLQPPTDTWPTYNGDYSGRRYSSLNQIKATPLEVNGILYFAAPDNAWAVDARSGRELWHFDWPTKGGLHIGNRGF